MSAPKQKTIFITGSSSGLGRAAARLFSAKGWTVFASMRSPQKEAELPDCPGSRWFHSISPIPQQIESTVARVLREGDVDVVFNNAGYGISGPLEGFTDEQMLRVIATNLLGPVRVTKAYIPHFRQRKGGFLSTPPPSEA